MVQYLLQYFSILFYVDIKTSKYDHDSQSLQICLFMIFEIYVLHGIPFSSSGVGASALQVRLDKFGLKKVK